MYTKYDFGTARNSYFQGHDGLIERKEDGATVRIRFSENRKLLAVNVKDDGYYHGANPPGGIGSVTHIKLLELIETRGEQYFEWLYARCQEEWWNEARWLTEEDDQRPSWTDGIWQEGRMGGWCVIKGTEPLADNFTTEQWTEQDEERVKFLDQMYDDPDTSADEREAVVHEHVDLCEKRDMIEMREEFCDLAFQLVANIDGVRKGYMTEQIDDDYEDLRAKREAAIVRGEE